MELRQIRYFQTVAQVLNVTRAAAMLHMAQPPLSRQIRQFEEEVGVPLFDRSGRSLRLTEAGRFLLDQSLHLTHRLEETLDATRRIGRNEKRWFGIGFVPSVLYGILPTLIRELRGDAPDVEVGLAEMVTVEQVDALKSGRIDLAFGRLAINDPAITQHVLMAEPLVAAMALAHAGTAPTTLDELARHPLILYPARPRPSYADHILSLFRTHGLHPNVALEANELQTALGLVAAGIGIALVPASVQRLHRDDVCYRQIDAPGFVSPVVMSHRAGDVSPFLARAVARVLGESGGAAQTPSP